MVKKKRTITDANDDAGSFTDSSDGEKSKSSLPSCRHVKKSVDAGKLRKTLKATGLALECSQCSKMRPSSATEKSPSQNDDDFEYDSTLWLCLKCGTQLCGRSRHQHALQHYQTPHSDSHALTLNTRSFEVWCYECDSEMNANSAKSLLECVEYVKKLAQKPPLVNNIEEKIIATWETLRPLVPGENDAGPNNAIPLPPPPPPQLFPGAARRINDASTAGGGHYASNSLPAVLNISVGYKSPALKAEPLCESLPRVRGLTNLGNTCFFNAVMQCLAQTPFLLEVLTELSKPGEKFTLPGGAFKFQDDLDIELPVIKGTLSVWGGLTASLADSLEELQSGGGVFTPSKLFEKLCVKCPQFRGGDQHDSHELLRHLLESVRSEDLKRYQRVILQDLGYENQDVNSASEEMRQKCKIYGSQASDRILRPDQVFRGFLVSTLTCQDCYNVSSRHEYFLDMSLPVSVEKPQPPQRRKTSIDNDVDHAHTYNSQPVGSSTLQHKKDKENEHKGKRTVAQTHDAQPVGYTTTRYQTEKVKQRQSKRIANNKATQRLSVVGVNTGTVESPVAFGYGTKDEASAMSSSSSSQQSDADVEDNLIDDNAIDKLGRPNAPLFDANGNDQLPSALNNEKYGDSPENVDKDSLDEDENDSGIATSPANAGDNFPSCSDSNSITKNATETATSIVAVGLSEKGATLVRHLSLGDAQNSDTMDVNAAALINGECDDGNSLAMQMDTLHIREQKSVHMRAKRVRTQSHSDWSTTIAPRYQCEDGECSVQSCLNNFTAVELMTSNNKVGCENCTKRINGDDPEAKTIYTNATKQFLISSPPAVLILHLKRFQLGPRCMFRKLTRAVSFPMILDVAPFCGSKVKNLPNIDRKQKKLLYALYGVVEHSGNMYGGHYTAYVKVRPKLAANDRRWKFIPEGSKAELDQDDEQRKKLDELLAKEKARELRLKAANDSDDFSNSSSASSTSSHNEIPHSLDADEGAVGGDEEAHNVQVPIGKWYYVSDSRVQEVNEDAVLKSQAYLLFYERIY